MFVRLSPMLATHPGQLNSPQERKKIYHSGRQLTRPEVVEFGKPLVRETSHRRNERTADSYQANRPWLAMPERCSYLRLQEKSVSDGRYEKAPCDRLLKIWEGQLVAGNLYSLDQLEDFLPRSFF
jgi:hypothetical protein